MKKRILAVAAAAALTACMFAGCGESASNTAAKSTAAASTAATSSTSAAASTDDAITIAMIGKAVNNDTWQTFFAGAKAAAAEVGGNVTLYTDGASDSTKREDQMNLIENYLSKGLTGLCFATDAEGATEIVDKYHDDGVKVVLVDTPIPGYETYDAQITYDNVTAGRFAAEALIEAMDKAEIDYSGDDARVVVQDPVSGVSTLDSRVEGIKAVFSEKAPNVTVDVMYCSGDNAQALSNAQDSWQKYGNQIVGMIGLDEGVTDAISRCLDENQIHGEFPVTGIDATTLSVGDVQSGNVYAVVGMSMYNLGYQGFMGIYNLCTGADQEKVVELDPILVTAENCMEDDIRATWDNELILGK